ncbi:MAG: anti-CBASS protein Acb1 family protein [Candidatus Heimdallarchaeaceae archaeon]
MKKIKRFKKKAKEVTEQTFNGIVTEIMSNEKDRGMIRNAISGAITNEITSRTNLLNKTIDERREIDDECGYPSVITTAQYRKMYDREGIATRIVNLYPEESWSQDPVVAEDEKADPTEFEKAWAELERELKIYSYMFRGDGLSGIGRFGIILLGFDDGKPLHQSVEGINEEGEQVGSPQHSLIYLRAFDESYVKVKSTEKDITNKRYGLPTSYNITFENETGSSSGSSKAGNKSVVHWSRVIHIADNRESSEVFGTPRMQSLFNRLYDIRKIAGGSGEMFWKGGFPGYVFQMDPKARELSSTEKNTLEDTIAAWTNGLQRTIRLQGMEIKGLEPQLADPKNHIDVQLQIIAIAMGVPKRILMGSEQAKLASSQDSENWSKRMKRRQNKYLTPYLIRPFIDRLITLGVLPEVEQYDVIWPDMSTPSEKDKAEVMKMQVEAYARYVSGTVGELIPEEIFLKLIAGFDEEQIKEIMEKAETRQEDMELEEEDFDEEEDVDEEETE